MLFKLHAKLAPRWVLIRVNFDPIQEIGPSVAVSLCCLQTSWFLHSISRIYRGWAPFCEWVLFRETTVYSQNIDLSSVYIRTVQNTENWISLVTATNSHTSHISCWGTKQQNFKLRDVHVNASCWSLDLPLAELLQSSQQLITMSLQDHM